MTDSKIKYIKYTNTLKQQRTIMDGYCSPKYNMTNISTKSKKQLKTRDSVVFNTRKKNYKKYNQDHMKLLDDSIERGGYWLLLLLRAFFLLSVSCCLLLASCCLLLLLAA